MEIMKILSEKIKQNKKRNILIKICNYLKKEEIQVQLTPFYNKIEFQKIDHSSR